MTTTLITMTTKKEEWDDPAINDRKTNTPRHHSIMLATTTKNGIAKSDGVVDNNTENENKNITTTSSKSGRSRSNDEERSTRSFWAVVVGSRSEKETNNAAAVASILLLHLVAFILAILGFSNITLLSSSSSLLPSSSTSLVMTTIHFYDSTMIATETTIGTPFQLPPSPTTNKVGNPSTVIFVDALQPYPYHIDPTTASIDSRRRSIIHRRKVRDHVRVNHFSREGTTANSNSLVLFGTPTTTATTATSERMKTSMTFANKNNDCYYGLCRTSTIGGWNQYPHPSSRKKRTTSTMRLWMISESVSNRSEGSTVQHDHKKGQRGPSQKQEALWKQRLDEMKQYQDENNGSSYPPRGTPLRYWATFQRTQFNKKQMYPYRIELLNSINFQWEKPRSGGKLNWGKMYDRLVEYKERFCDTKVPQHYPEDPQLGKWCYDQKVAFHKGTLDRERRHKLDGIGFVFDEIFSREDRWDDKYDRLVEYWKKHNSTLVPIRYEDDPELGDWVNKQRFYHNKNDSRMTPERIERLEAIGFVWDAQEAVWEEMYNRLVEYKQEKGNAKVPQRYKKDPKLGSWVKHQRKTYKKGKLSPDRIEKLEAIGFVWRINKSKGEKDELQSNLW